VRIGISLMYWPWFAPPEQLALAVQADRLGLHSVWVAEGYGQEAAAVLGLLAGRTDRILLGAGIMQIPARQPTTAAMVASTVDRLSGGRMLLGLGLSGAPGLRGLIRRAVHRAAATGTREYVEIIRLALSGRRVAYEGTEWNLPARGGLGLGKPLKLIAAPPSAARLIGVVATAGCDFLGCRLAAVASGCLVDDALDLAAVDVEVAGDGALAVTRLAPCKNRLLQRWRGRQFQRCFLFQFWCWLVPKFAFSITCPCAAPGADEHHQ
jgi:hypothetical protein